MYWYFNKITKQPGIFSNLEKLSQAAGISRNTLYYHFSRRRRADVVIKGEHHIVSLKPNDFRRSDSSWVKILLGK